MSAAGLLDATLGPAVIGHLDAQLVSARRLLDLVLRQGQAIRRQDVEAVVARLGELQAEMERRGRLEGDRTQLLTQAGAVLGLPAHAITLDALTSLMRPEDATAVAQRSAELRGLLAEVGREHSVNRSLMRQELAFLDHLTRLLGAESQGGYGPTMEQRTTVEPRAAALRVLDLRA
jgi:hypothetical protein